MARYKRRIQLIKPSLQLRLTLVFVALGAIGLVLQLLFFTARLAELAVFLPQDGEMFATEVDRILLEGLLVSALVFLPLTFAVGVLTTFRIAGPLYRFEMHLKQLLRGERPGPIRLRKGDQLVDFCELLNRTVASLLATSGTEVGPEPAAEEAEIREAPKAPEERRQVA
jgi:hypothetical protein